MPMHAPHPQQSKCEDAVDTAMTKLYLAGPMFCDAELSYNLRLKELMAAEGYDLVLPQEKPLAISPEKMSDPEYRDAATMMVFEADTQCIRECDALVFLMDGRVPDEGACMEVGYAYAIGKECFGLKTDKRVSELGTDNLMIGGAVKLRV